MAHFFEDESKVKIPSEIKPPLQYEHLNFREPQGVVSICWFKLSSDAKIASQCRHLFVSLLIGTKILTNMIYNEFFCVSIMIKHCLLTHIQQDDPSTTNFFLGKKSLRTQSEMVFKIKVCS